MDTGFPPPVRGVPRARKAAPSRPQADPAYEGLFKFLSTSFWASYVMPPAPGTAGMCVGIGLWYLIGRIAPQPFFHFLVLFVFFGAGIYITDRASMYWGSSEESFMSYDMMVGMMVAGSPFHPGFHANWMHMMAAVVTIYWFLSVLQPFPINQCRELPGGLRFMVDDLLAAIVTMVATWGFYRSFWEGALGLN